MRAADAVARRCAAADPDGLLEGLDEEGAPPRPEEADGLELTEIRTAGVEEAKAEAVVAPPAVTGSGEAWARYGSRAAAGVRVARAGRGGVRALGVCASPNLSQYCGQHR